MNFRGEIGQPPDDPEDLYRVSIDPADIHRFWRAHYLERFIRSGGSKVKWITGPEGSGKTHALRRWEADARDAGLLTVGIDAGVTPLRGMLEFARAVLTRLDREPVLEGLTRLAVGKLGYEPRDVPEGRSVLAWLVEDRGRIRDRVARDLVEAAEQTLAPLDIDLNLKAAVAVALETRLGVAVPGADALDRWFRGESVPKRQLAVFGMSQSLSRLNARAVLQGWAALALHTGLAGILVTVDRFEQVLAPREDGRPYYTAGRRNETYEMIRQLIDDADVLRGLLVVIAGRPELFSDARRGVKSYPALDERIANEVTPVHVNRFQDVTSWPELYVEDATALERLRARWAEALGVTRPAEPIAAMSAVSPVRRTVEAVWAVAPGRRAEGDGTND